MAAKWTDVFVREADGASVYEPFISVCLFGCIGSHIPAEEQITGTINTA